MIALAGETRNPSRYVPVALIGSVLIGVLIYVGLQVALITAINPGDIGNGWEHLHFIGMFGPPCGDGGRCPKWPTDALGFDGARTHPHMQPPLQRSATHDAFERLLQFCQAQALRASGKRARDVREEVIGKEFWHRRLHRYHLMRQYVKRFGVQIKFSAKDCAVIGA